MSQGEIFPALPAEDLKNLLRAKRGCRARQECKHRRNCAAGRGGQVGTLRAERKVPLQEYLFGLGGRDLYPRDAKKFFRAYGK